MEAIPYDKETNLRGGCPLRGHNRTFRNIRRMSALRPRADICRVSRRPRGTSLREHAFSEVIGCPLWLQRWTFDSIRFVLRAKGRHHLLQGLSWPFVSQSAF